MKIILAFLLIVLISDKSHASILRPQYYNVKDYGAVGNGVVDDSTATRSAIAVATTSGGGTVYFPCGTYLLGSKIPMYSSTTLMGSSYGCVTLKAKINMNDRLVVNEGRDSGSTDTNITFQNLIFDLNGANQTVSDTPTFSRENYLQFLNCKFINAYDSLLGITGNPTPNLNNNIFIDKCIFDGTNQQQSTDLFDVGDGSNVVITNSFFYNSKGGNQGILEPSVINHFVVRDCFFDGNGSGTPIEMKGINGGEFIGNEVKNSAGEGVGFFAWHEIAPYFQGRDFVISNNNIHDNATSGIYINAPGSPSDTVYNLSISNNSIHDNSQEGLKIQTAHELTIGNNFIYNNSKSSAGTYAAVNFAGAAVSTDIADVRVYGNTFYDIQTVPTQTFGYNLNSNVSTVTIHNNFYRQITTKMTKTTPTNIQFLDSNNEGVISTVGSFTRDNTAASANVAYTGIGFQPSGVSFFSAVVSTNTSSWGFDNVSSHTAIASMSNGVYDTWSAQSIATEVNGSNTQTGHVISFDADGFTIAWTKTGSPTGTATIQYMAIR